MKLTSQMCSTFGSSWPAYFGNRFRCAESIRCHTVFTCEREHVGCRPLIYDQDAARHSARRGDIGYSCETPHAPQRARNRNSPRKDSGDNYATRENAECGITILWTRRAMQRDLSLFNSA